MFTIGTDIEVFLMKNMKYKSAVGIIKGTKEKPLKITKHIHLSHDNVCAEFTVKPANNAKDFVNNISKSFAVLSKSLPKDIFYIICPSAEFPEQELKTRAANRFGCDKDFNVWTMKATKVICKRGNRLRTCGGHVHIGSELLKSDEDKMMLVRILDYTLGAMSAWLDSGFDALRRRQLYGAPGCYRPTSYGVEYRTLSNFWTAHADMCELVYYLVKDSLTILKDGSFVDLFREVNPLNIQEMITQGNTETAEHYLINVLSKYLCDNTNNIINNLLKQRKVA